MLHTLRLLLHQLPTLLPSTCVLCMLPHTSMLCDGCKQQCLMTHTLRCDQCGHPRSTTSTEYACRFCASHIPAFDATIVAADYARPIDRLVIALKFSGQLHLAVLLAQLLRDASLQAARRIALPDILCPTPLSAQRLQARGYNQALEIARPLGKMLGIATLPALLSRHRHTDAQSTLNAEGRSANLRQAFRIADGMLPKIEGQHIGVVDDVMTTGQTFNEIATVLKAAGAARVTNLVFARTLLL